MSPIDLMRFDKIKSGFHNKKIMVIGDLMIDEYLIGHVTRISPEAPVPVVEIKEETLRFGGAANVALNILSLDCIPVLVGVVGKDLMGERFAEILTEKKISKDGVVPLDNRPTTVKTRIIGHTQHIARVDRESRIYLEGDEEKEVILRISELVKDVDAIILEDYNKGVLTENVIEATISLARQKNKLITVDPKFLNFLKFKNVSVFKPNIKETEEALAVHLNTEEALINAGKKLLDKLQAESVLITRGSQGMTLFESDGTITHVPTNARKVADVSGAGDTVISTLTAALAGKASHREAAILANYAAGIVCEEVGIVPVDIDKLRKVCAG